MTPWTVAPPGSSVREIFQAEILEWVAIFYSRDLPNPGIEPESLVTLSSTGGFLTTEPPTKIHLLVEEEFR